MDEDDRRLFFGIEVSAPWPSHLPEGRIIDEEMRHITLAFLGNTSFSQLKDWLPHFPLPSFKLGIAGICDKLLFLPHDHPRVASYHISWMEKEDRIKAYQKALQEWLKEKEYKIDVRDFLAHVTLARAPFRIEEWKESFHPIPVITKGIHLYESVGSLKYLPRWSHSFTLPFEEFEHTADIAFKVRGENMEQLHLHAQIALAFKYPSIIPYFSSTLSNSLDDIVIELNHLISRADQEIGCPFKAVSFHGTALRDPHSILNWEMIVDV